MNFLRKVVVLFFIINSFIIRTDAKSLQETFYNVDKLEIYGIVDNAIKLYEVKYFEGKIVLIEENGVLRCISTKTNEHYLKFQYSASNNLLITSTIFESCKGIIEKNQLSQKQLLIQLEDKKVMLKYYLRKLSTDSEIYNTISSGTGIILDKNTVLTNYHVIKGATKISIDFGSQSFNLSVSKYDASLDIAVLKTKDEFKIDNQLLTFSNYDIDIGQQTYVSGFPLISTMGSQLKFTSGIVSSLTGYDDDNRYLQTTAPIDPGNSGCPLIDQYGNIIGIVSAKHSYGTNVGYALKIKYLLNEKIITQTTSKKIILTPQQIYSKAKKTVCIIKSFYL